MGWCDVPLPHYRHLRAVGIHVVADYANGA